MFWDKIYVIVERRYTVRILQHNNEMVLVIHLVFFYENKRGHIGLQSIEYLCVFFSAQMEHIQIRRENNDVNFTIAVRFFFSNFIDAIRNH